MGCLESEVIFMFGGIFGVGHSEKIMQEILRDMETIKCKSKIQLV